MLRKFDQDRASDSNLRIPVLVNTIKNAVSLTERDLSRRQAAGDECFRVFGSPPPSGGEKNLPPPCVVEASLQYQRPGEKPKGVKPDCQLSGAAGPPYEFCQSLTRLFSESVKVDCLAKECPTNDQRRSRSPRHATRGLSCESISPADKFRCRRRASDGRSAAQSSVR